MKEKAEMTREELIALGWMKKPSDKMQEKPKNQLTAVEFLLRELKKYGDTCPNYEINYVIEIPTHILTELEEQAKEMEKEQKIEFACKVAEASAEKYIQGKTTEQIAKELLTFKSQ